MRDTEKQQSAKELSDRLRNREYSDDLVRQILHHASRRLKELVDELLAHSVAWQPSDNHGIRAKQIYRSTLRL